MEIKVYQIIVVILGLLFQVLIVRKFVQGSFRLPELLVSSLTLIIVFFAAMFPDGFSSKLAYLLGIESNINAVLFGGLLLSLWLNFRLWMILRNLEKKFSRIISQLSILNELEEKKNTEND
jgi:hypothetical protein